MSEKAIPRSLLPPARKLAATKAIGTLKAYALITEREEPDTYNIHQLVRLAMINWLEEKGELNEWTDKVLQRLADAFPFPKHKNRGIWTRYLPHTQYMLELQNTVDDKKAGQVLLSNVGDSFDALGQYQEAEVMHRQVLQSREKVLGPEHPDTLVSVSNLGSVLKRQGKYEEAEVMHQRELLIREKVLGPGHPDTLTSISNLGWVLRSQEKYKEAEVMHQLALLGYEKVLGPEHPDTLTSISQLGSVLKCQGKYEEAKAMYQQVLEGKEKVLGPEHPVPFSRPL
jgi:tetratricopeptide (TPR) repeat protein